MRQALEHLLLRHGCRRIAFIRGPAVNAEAERRYAIYRAVLHERGLAHRPDARLRGDLREERRARRPSSCSSTSARCTFDAPRRRNDYMALGAIPRARRSAACRSPPTSR